MFFGKVSVVIPMYNAAGFVTETIKSVLSQSYKDIEVVVVDDGSQDSSSSVVEAIDDSRILLVSQENKGVCAARNTGIARASGEWVYLLDADDLLTPNALEVRLERMYEKGFRACYSRIRKVGKDGTCKGYSRSKAPSGWILPQMEKEFLFECGSNGMMHRDVLDLLRLASMNDEACYYQPKWFGGCEDWEFALRLAAVTGILFISDPLVAYTVGHNPTSRSAQRNSMLAGHRRLMDLISDDWFLQQTFPVIECA